MASGELKIERSRFARFDPGNLPLRDVVSTTGADPRISAALWATQVGFWEVDVTLDRIHWWNDWYTRFDIDPCMGDGHALRWNAQIHPDDVERTLSYEALVDGRTGVYEAEYRIRTSAGGWRWILSRGCAVERGLDGRAKRIVGVTIDIDRRKRAELALRASEERLELAVWGGAFGSWDWDVAHDRVEWLNEWCDRLDLARCEGSDHQRQWNRRIHPDDRARIRAIDAELHAGTRSSYEYEYRHRTLGGEWRWLADRGRVVTRSPDGKPTRIAGVCMDVTERVRLERQILEVASREQQRIAADLHDGLGQDLTGIALTLRSIAGSASGSSPRLAGEITKVIGMVNEVIASTRALAHGLAPISGAPGALGAALRSLAQRTRTAQRIRVDVRLGAVSRLELPQETATHLFRIAQEAVANAVRHGHARRISIRAAANERQLMLSITDDGCGLADREAGARGIGLRTMAHRASLIGGALAIERPQAGGTRIVCRLAWPARVTMPRAAGG